MTWPLASERISLTPMVLKPSLRSSAKNSLTCSIVSPLRPISARAYPRRRKDRVDDRLVAGAAADVAGDRLDNVGAVRVGIAVEQRLGGDDHARRAEAALRREPLRERCLQRMHRTVPGDAFKRYDVPAFDALGGHETGERQLAVDGHGAGAAGALLAADLRRQEAEFVPQEVGEDGSGFDELGLLRAVDRQGEGDACHITPPMRRAAVAGERGAQPCGTIRSPEDRSAACSRRSRP